jgi:hypothetical protein
MSTSQHRWPVVVPGQRSPEQSGSFLEANTGSWATCNLPGLGVEPPKVRGQRRALLVLAFRRGRLSRRAFMGSGACWERCSRPFHWAGAILGIMTRLREAGPRRNKEGTGPSAASSPKDLELKR